MNESERKKIGGKKETQDTNQEDKEGGIGEKQHGANEGNDCGIIKPDAGKCWYVHKLYNKYTGRLTDCRIFFRSKLICGAKETIKINEDIQVLFIV